ncbi:MAG: hypothetical protein P1U39_04610 [Legionellaceae bacterium]|nr:hypothetical protein [Legionellaceae bacterium]
MNDTVATQDNPVWLSTYGLLTAERLLERFNISLSHEELLDVFRNPGNPYHHLLTVPVKNISNGIIIKQVHAYQVYMQKLLIDYKLNSTQATIENDQKATGSPSEIDLKYHELVEISGIFEEKKQAHQHLIAKSQSWLIQQTRESILEITAEVSSMLETFSTQAESLRLAFIDLMQQFRDLIIQTTDILMTMSDYTIDVEQMEENKSWLDFDPLLED